MTDEAIDVIDLERVRSLKDDIGDADFFRELLGMFVTTSAAALKELDEAVQRGDAEATRLASHSLKGCASNIGANGLAELWEAIERAGAAGQLEDLAKQVAQGAAGLARVQVRMEEIAAS